MNPDIDMQISIILEAYRTFPTSIADAVFGTPEFGEALSHVRRTTVSLGNPSITFDRKRLHDTISGALDSSEEQTIDAEDGSKWQIGMTIIGDQKRVFLYQQGGKKSLLPDYWYLSPVDSDRLSGLDGTLGHIDGDEHIQNWRAKISSSRLNDEDVSLFEKELMLLPEIVFENIQAGVSRGETPTSTLAPTEFRYYERLVGKRTTEAATIDYLQGGASAHAAQQYKQKGLEGLKNALLLSSHPKMADVLHSLQPSNEDVRALFKWLAESGDRFSQVGGFEWGVRMLEHLPELERPLISIAEQIKADDPRSPNGRLKQLATLVSFIDGGLAHAGTSRDAPPFWRRMGVIAQASLIERAFIASGLETNATREWKGSGRGQYFYIQTLVDLRTEPRWLPDFLEPEQLKAEFSGRLVGAAAANANKIKSSKLRELLIEENESGLKADVRFPFAFLPGPLEGATEAQTEPPTDLVETVRSQLKSASDDPHAFTALVNTSLVFKVAPGMASLAAEAIRQAKYLVRASDDDDQAFALLAGLAVVAGVTRSTELANELRTLARVVRRRSKAAITPAGYFRIGMFAAAAFADIAAWRNFVGDWMTELSFSDMVEQEARVLAGHLDTLLDIDADLWGVCGKAHTALRAALEVARMSPDVEAKGSLGILAYGSLINDPGAEISAATTKKLSTDVATPFPVEFARSSSSRKNAPTLVPVDNGEFVKAIIFVLADKVTVSEARDMLWRRETRNATGTYRPPANPTNNSVLVKELDLFHGIGQVLYTSIAANIETLTAEHLADLAIESAQAVSNGGLVAGRDGITYLRDALSAGIKTRLSDDYLRSVLKKSGCSDLDTAIEKLTASSQN
ncbi:hypothetical protein NKI50_27875 [Mesorhizobium sp. M0563]|uniref:hypothetical protein n=2 Tax=unclassified Mesorhizobium TaxID=325217 RepID=UPI003336F6FF